jgi:hypothetical protein
MHLAGEEPESANGMLPGSREETASLVQKWGVLLAEHNLRNTSLDRRASSGPLGEGSVM